MDKERTAFSFESEGHLTTYINGHKFVQYQEHEEEQIHTYRGPSVKKNPLPLGRTPPILYSFWGGYVMTGSQIKDILDRSNIRLVANQDG